MNIIEIMNRWPNQETAINHLEKVRWGGHPICPYCKSDKVCVHASKDKSLPRWQCETCHSAFSATVGTIFHHTHLPLQTWFLAIALMLNAKKNLSNSQLARDLNLHYKTAWKLALRIRTAMLNDPKQERLFHGIVEMDETFIGGKPRKGNGKHNKRGRGTDKMAVVGIVERNGMAKAKRFEKLALNLKGLSSYFKSHVDSNGSILMTDEYTGYNGFKNFTQHSTVDHKNSYVIGDVHTNTIEGLWALLKRAWYGQHHHYSDKWANYYISETVYKYNNRNNTNSFSELIMNMVGVVA
jgi:transposase-like protein